MRISTFSRELCSSLTIMFYLIMTYPPSGFFLFHDRTYHNNATFFVFGRESCCVISSRYFVQLKYRIQILTTWNKSLQTFFNRLSLNIGLWLGRSTLSKCISDLVFHLAPIRSRQNLRTNTTVSCKRAHKLI